MPAAVLAVAAVIAVLVLAGSADARPASGCATPPQLVPLDQVDVAFVGELIGDRDGTATIAVTDAYKGVVTEKAKVLYGSGEGDGSLEQFVGGRMVGVLAEEVEPGRYRVPVCAGRGIVSAVAVRALFEPLRPQATGGEPAHVLGYAMGGARVAVVDAEGAILGYGAGAGTVLEFAVCPGGERIVELYVDGDPGPGGTGLAQVAVRDLATMEVVDTRIVGPGVVIESGRPLEPTPIGDLYCGDASGTEILYLVTGSAGGPEVHRWIGAERQVYRVFDQKQLAVDPGGRRFYTVGTDGRNLFTWDLDTGSEILPFEPFPDDFSAQDLAVSPDGREIVLVGRTVWGTGFNPNTATTTAKRMLSGPPGGPYEQTELAEPGRLPTLELTPDGLGLAVLTSCDYGAPCSISALLVSGDTSRSVKLPAPAAVASVHPSGLLVLPDGQYEVSRLWSWNGDELAAISGPLVPGVAAAPLLTGTEIGRESAVDPPYEAAGRIVVNPPDPAALLRWWPAILGAVLAAVSVAVVLVRRRRRHRGYEGTIRLPGMSRAGQL